MPPGLSHRTWWQFQMPTCTPASAKWRHGANNKQHTTLVALQNVFDWQRPSPRTVKELGTSGLGVRTRDWKHNA